MQNKSFTLIELLVVIAIIGLIASIVLVNVGGLQGKARLTKTLEFSQSLNNALGAYMVGYWSFDDQASPTKDSSGYNNHGTLVNAPTFNSNTPHAAIDRGTGRYALSFNGTNQSVNSGSAIDELVTNAITFEAWFNAFSDQSATAPALISTLNSFRTQEQGGPRFNVYLYIDGADRWFGGVPAFSLNSWHHYVFTYDSSTRTGVIYVDGVAGTPTTLSALSNYKISTTNWPTYIGLNSMSGAYFNGLIDEVKIYEKAMSLGEIQQHYAEGLERHQNLVIR